MSTYRRVLFAVQALALIACLGAETLDPVRVYIGEKSAPLRTKSVVVFPQGAVVERSGKINIPAGETKIVVKYLPQRVDENSIRVAVSGIAGGGVGGVEVFLDKFIPKPIKQLRDSIQKLDDRLDELKSAEEGIKLRQKFLESIASLGGVEQSQSRLLLSPQNFAATARFIESQYDELIAASTKIKRERRRVQEIRSKLKEQLDRMTGAVLGRGYRVEVPVWSSGGAATVVVRYTVSGAGWTPQYDAKYDEKTGKVELVYYGTVSQSTGEDWSKVKLTLSTTQPRAGTEPPELSIWYLRKRTPRRLPPRPRGAAAPVMKEALALEAAFEPEVTEAVRYGERIVFEVPGQKTVPADGQEHRLVVAKLMLDARKKFTTVPKLDPKVYVTAKCKNSSDYILLPGKVSVFQGNEFVGTQWIREPIAFGEEFTVAMGPVKLFDVERKRTKEFSERTGIIGQNKREQFTYEITISNNSAKPATVEVVDQIPVSADEDIKVVDVRFEPSPDETDRDFEGQLIWSVELEPNQKRRITFSFAVKYPKNVVVEGL